MTEPVSPSNGTEPVASSGPSRRRFLAGGAAAGVGAAVAVGLGPASDASDAVEVAPLNGTLTVPFHGPHQAGVTMAPQAFQNLVALRLRPELVADDLRRLLVLLTDDAARMTSGTFALADSEPELALTPARLTVTVGFGPAVVDLVRGPGSAPSWLGPLPAFPIDRLEDRWSGGDLLLQVASDDPLTLAHATRMLLKDCRSFATVAWQQHGFRVAQGSQPEGTTMRNMLGQVDGTANVPLDDPDIDRIVWRTDDWLDGGTTIVIRRIEMLLDKWDRLDRSGREATIGRRLANGAPLTGELEHDEPDLEATTPIGFPVIAEFAHMRRARPSSGGVDRILRRGYNYDLGPTERSITDAGLVFTSFQADVELQFLPIQRRLAELDLLNEWTVPIGSAVFAIPPGVEDGEFLGSPLFD